MTQTLNNKIQRAFSRSARSYDQSSGLHRQIADMLFEHVVNGHAPSALLDVGCGTGYLTVKFKERFPEAQVIGLDFSPGMIEVARPKNDSITWVLADGENLPFTDGSFDILISNLAYQWAIDLARAFKEARRVLTPKGILACTLFGRDTCQELFQSLEEAKANALQFARLPDESRIRGALIAGGFADIKVVHEQIKIRFGSLRELMSWLKSIGANNLSKEGFLGPEAINRASGIYLNKFPFQNGVGATFEVMRVYARK